MTLLQTGEDKVNTIQSSIIIPSFNRSKQITELLAALNRDQVETGSFEVIVVDDGSEPPLSINRTVYQYPVTLIRQENNGPAQARNRGAAIAQGQHLIFIDDDCLPSPGWLAAFQKAAARYPDSALGGMIRNGIPKNPYSHASQMLLDYLGEHYSPDNHLGGFFPSANILVPNSIFSNLGGFNSSLRFGEDREFCYRWSTGGHGHHFVADAEISHAHRMDFTSFLVRHFKYGWGTYSFRKIIRKNKLKQPGIASPYFYLKLILHPFNRTNRTSAMLYSFLLIVLHLSYGCGFLWKSAHDKLTGNGQA